MNESPPDLPWHSIPPGSSTCEVYLMQAGGLYIPEEMAILPGPNQPNKPSHTDNKPTAFYAPDYVFLIEHTASGNKYMFDLGIRTDLTNLPPYIIKNVLPQFHCEPVSPADILHKHASPEQQPEKIKAVIFSHMHFDHVGDGAKAGFSNAELWVGPTCCTYARPGYPVEDNAPTLSDTLPADGSRKIVEAFVRDEVLERVGDKRAGQVGEAKKKGKYEAVELMQPEWIGLGAFDRGYDAFGDGSAYLIDAAGHSAGHQMMLVRTQTGGALSGDTFVLLAGDCFHHPELLKDPRRTARPPYSESGMHADPEQAVDTIWRTREFAKKDYVWVLAAHDFTVTERIASEKKYIEGLVRVNEWFEQGWKKNVVPC